MITTHDSQNLIFLTFFMILSLLSLLESCDAKCTPSSCGTVHNIGYPFRLKGDPKKCGDPRFKLACENNVASIILNSHKYYVKAINYSQTFLYDNSTIRLVDASLNNDNICSFPTYYEYAPNFTFANANSLPYLIPVYPSDSYDDKPLPINFISCPKPLINSSLFTDITAHCGSNSSHHHRYSYVKVGHMKVSEMPHTCGDVIVMTFWDFKNLSNVSLLEIHEALLYGFEFTIRPLCLPSKNFRLVLLQFLALGVIPSLLVILGLLCAALSPPLFTICGFAAVLQLSYLIVSVLSLLVQSQSPLLIVNALSDPLLIIDFIIVLSRIIIFPLALWLLIYTFRRRHQSAYKTIESFLQNLRPSMNTVLEMLEADVERLKIPEYPSQPTQIVVNAEETGTTFSTDYVSALQHLDAPSVEISVEE
ncbi:hypothetical protein AAHA92_19155 [Salvia divinorum]|uniref:Wall-associated receptor kinase galacturonan-binding domain-containing protein n=1 Tax=Salvia divinorum TaxID=28513 RepID=A0ABD1H512_SALDI